MLYRTVVIILFTCHCVVAGFSQELEKILPVVASNGMFLDDGSIPRSDNTLGRCVSPNKKFHAEYTYEKVGFDYFQVGELRLFQDSIQIAIIHAPKGVGFYLSNSGIVAAVDITESISGESTVYFYSPQGALIFSYEIKHPSQYKFSSSGEVFGVNTAQSLILIHPQRQEVVLLDQVERFDLSDSGHCVVGIKNGRLFVWQKRKLIQNLNTNLFVARKIALSPDHKNVAIINKKEIQVYSIEDGKQLFKDRLESNLSFRDLRFNEERIFTGIQKKQGSSSQGILKIYDLVGNEFLWKAFPAEKQPSLRSRGTKIRQFPREPIMWPYAPFDSAYAIGTSYEEYQDYSGLAYLHTGVDIMAPDYTNVYSVSEGVVKAVLTTSHELHWRVAVADRAGPETCEGWLYAHLVENSIAVEVGDTVHTGDYLGKIIPWPYHKFTHCHFAKVRQSGEIWHTDWDALFNPLEVLQPNTDSTAPIFFNAKGSDQFAFCRNETSFYLPSDYLCGKVDIIAQIGDYIESDKYQCAIYRISYWLKELATQGCVLGPIWAVVLSHEIPYYLPSSSLAHIIYKNDGVCNSEGNYLDRRFYYILTNNDGDSLLEVSDRWQALNTSQFVDGEYRIFVQAEDAYGNATLDSMDVTFNNGNTGVDKESANTPQDVQLYQNYPNPFNATTRINYFIPGRTSVKLTIFDALGRTIRNLVRNHSRAGVYHFIWNGTDHLGRSVASGIYYYQFQTQGFCEQKKLILLK